MTEEELKEMNEEVQYSQQELKLQQRLQKLEQVDERETPEQRIARYKMEKDLERERRMEEIKRKAKRLLEEKDSLFEFYDLEEEDNGYMSGEERGYGLFDDQMEGLK